MPSLADFSAIVRSDEPLAPYCWMRLGGPAQYFIQPRSVEELTGVLAALRADGIPYRCLGGGSNLLVREEGVSGAVIHLAGDHFSEITTNGLQIRAGAGAQLSNVVSHAVRAGLAGLENLVGIPGTLGGAIRGNAGGRSGDIGQYVESVTVLTSTGEIQTRRDDELLFAYRSSNLQDVVILEATLALQTDEPEEITRRLRKLWITKKATQPYGFQSAGCIFKNPRGISASRLLDQAGLKGTRVGEAEVSDRHANFFVTKPGATAQDVLRLIDLARSKVAEQFGVDLELEIEIW